LVIEKQEVSRKHAEIFCRDSLGGGKPTYFLSDDSTFGTFILGPNGWQKVFHQEVPLQSGTQLKFGSVQGQTWEFIIQDNIE
jgi:pSer/pThr/pTyr-binding forkhead associated (FHA) protein